MAEKEEKKHGELRHIDICVVENGYQIRACYDPVLSLSQKAGWTPQPYEEPKNYVEKTKDAVLKRLKEIL